MLSGYSSSRAPANLSGQESGGFLSNVTIGTAQITDRIYFKQQNDPDTGNLAAYLYVDPVTDNLIYNSPQFSSVLYQIGTDPTHAETLFKINPTSLEFNVGSTLETLSYSELWNVAGSTSNLQNQINNISTAVVSSTAKWGSFYSTVSQSASANTPTIMTINVADPSGNQVIMADANGGGSYQSVQVLSAGIYNVQFSVQVTHSNSSQDTIQIWLRKNGSDFADSNGSQTVQLNNGDQIMTWNWVLPLAANDKIRLMWATNSTSVNLIYRAAQTTPYASPAIPSVILTVTQVMNTSPGLQGPKGDKGDKGDTGAQGGQGPMGPTGPKGQKGDSDNAGWILGLGGIVFGTASLAVSSMVALGLFAGVTAEGAAEGGIIGGIQAQLSLLEDAVTALQGKTALQNCDGVANTYFSQTLNVGSALYSSRIVLGGPTGDITTNGGDIRAKNDLGSTTVHISGNSGTIDTTGTVSAPTFQGENFNGGNMSADTATFSSLNTGALGTETQNLGGGYINIGNGLSSITNINGTLLQNGLPTGIFNAATSFFSQW